MQVSFFADTAERPAVRDVGTSGSFAKVLDVLADTQCPLRARQEAVRDLGLLSMAQPSASELLAIRKRDVGSAIVSLAREVAGRDGGITLQLCLSCLANLSTHDELIGTSAVADLVVSALLGSSPSTDFSTHQFALAAAFNLSFQWPVAKKLLASPGWFDVIRAECEPKGQESPTMK